MRVLAQVVYPLALLPRVALSQLSRNQHFSFSTKQILVVCPNLVFEFEILRF